MAIAERVLQKELPVYTNGHHTDEKIKVIEIAEGWPSYADLGNICCSFVYPHTPQRRPVALGPVTPLALREANAILKPTSENQSGEKPKGYSYNYSVALTKKSLFFDETSVTSIEQLDIPLVYFKDTLYGEQNFKNQDFHDGELWRIVRFGSQHGDRLAVPFIRFNTSAVSVLAQNHYSFDNSRFYKPEPSVKTYAPMTGNAEEFLLGINGTDVSARLRVNAQFNGI